MAVVKGNIVLNSDRVCFLILGHNLHFQTHLQSDAGAFKGDLKSRLIGILCRNPVSPSCPPKYTR